MATHKRAKAPEGKTAGAVKAEGIKEEFIIQFHGREISNERILERFKENWTVGYGKDFADVHEVTYYVKPEEDAVYYVVNGTEQGSFQI